MQFAASRGVNPARFWYSGFGYKVSAPRNSGMESGMAELSDHDKKILLGPNYKALEEQARRDSGLTDKQHLAESKRGKTTGYRMTGAIFAGLAAIIFVSNHMQASGPYQPNLAWAAAIVGVLSAAVAVYMHMDLQKA